MNDSSLFDLNYIFKYETPLTGLIFNLKSFNSFIQLNLVKKHLITDFSNSNSFLEFLNFLKKVLYFCTSPLDQPKLLDLNLLDYLYLIIHLRCITYGNELNLLIDVSDNEEYKHVTDETQKISYKFDLDAAIEKWSFNIKNNLKKEDFFIESENFLVKLNLIPYNKNSYFKYENVEEGIKDNLFFFNFIEKIDFKNVSVELNSLKDEQKLLLLNQLPVKIFNEIKEKIYYINDVVSKVDFYNFPDLIQDKLHLFNNSIPELLNLTFSEKLINIYKEYYLLNKKHIDSSYINEISPIERQFYLNIVKEEYENIKKSQEKAAGVNNAVDLISN